MTMFSMAGNTPDRTLSVIYATGDTATVPESHDKFEQLVSLLLSGAEDAEVSELVDKMLAVSKHLAQLSERVSIRNRKVLFDGDQLRGELADAMLDIYETGNPETLRPLVNFLEKASTNPSRQSIDDMYRWISNGDMLLHEDGDMLAYKGVQSIKGERYSINSGTAFVNGEEITGYIPNPDGAVVTMPRSAVDDNSNEACSTGLHVGTASYAFGFARTETILAKFNPRDIVAVPSDSNGEKMRICRYVVQGTVESRWSTRVFHEEPQIVEEKDQSPTGTVQLDVIPDFEVVAFGYVDVDEDESTEELDFDPEGLSSDETLEDFRPTEAEVLAAEAGQAEEAGDAQVVRDSKGRFTSESAAKAVRNAKGQFTKKS